MTESSFKLLKEFKYIVAVYNYKRHSSTPVQIIDDGGNVYICVFDYVTNEPVRLKSQRGDGERLFSTLSAAYNAIRTDLDWQGQIALIKD